LNDTVLAEKNGMNETAFREKVAGLKSKLLMVREKRVRPGLDDKTLLSWNALMATGYLDAYDAFGEVSFLKAAERNVNFILENMMGPGGNLFHSFKNDRSTVNGFLEDYAFFIQTLIRLYQVSFEIKYLELAKKYAEYVIQHFKAGKGEHFYFTSDEDPALISRTRETQDNVIPASNSQMAINLFFLGNYFENKEWLELSNSMLFSMQRYLTSYGAAYSNWLLLWIYVSRSLTEIVITGPNALDERSRLATHICQPGAVIAGSHGSSDLALLEGRTGSPETLIYVCSDHQCQMPVSGSEAALALLSQ
jgi:uncharacterized protein YyaL (SSP411 family)